MSILVIGEKPSVSRELAKVLGAEKKKNGYLEDERYIVTWCVGHLVTLSYPDKYDERLKKWELETLPFIPKEYKYEVIPEVAAQYKVVKTLLNRKDVDRIYYSGDSAREGEYIQRLVRQMAGRNKEAKEFRVWIDSQTREEIRNGIKNAHELAYYDKLSDSAYARAIEDYLVGIDFSRVLSIKYANMVSGAAGIRYTDCSRTRHVLRPRHDRRAGTPDPEYSRHPILRDPVEPFRYGKRRLEDSGRFRICS